MKLIVCGGYLYRDSKPYLSISHIFLHIAEDYLNSIYHYDYKYTKNL